VPNVSEGRDQAVIDRVATGFGAGLVNVHADPDHHRSVFTLVGESGSLAHAVLAGAREAVGRIDITRQEGVHPRIGAVDVAPIVYVDRDDRGAACAEALVLGEELGTELELPVLMYGGLAQGRTRAELRLGGPTVLARRLAEGELVPDFGPGQFHPTAGAVLVAARPPLVAFNLELAAPATLEQARAVAGAIREGGPDGLPGVCALGLWLAHRGRAQVSMNIEDHTRVPLHLAVDAVRRHAPVAEAELIGLAPRAALEEFPGDVPLRNRATIEEALG
jgi:glutamate formiminotransferase